MNQSLKNSLVVAPFFVKMQAEGATKEFDYEESLACMISSLRNYSVKVEILTDRTTNFRKDLQGSAYPLGDKSKNLMKTVVDFESKYVNDKKDGYVWLCGSDEYFIDDPYKVLDHDYDLVIPYDGLFRIMNGFVIVKINSKTKRFFLERKLSFDQLPKKVQDWGADMATYNLVFKQRSIVFLMLSCFAILDPYPTKYKRQFKTIQSKIGKLLLPTKLSLNIGGLRVLLIQWDKYIARSVKPEDIKADLLEEGIVMLDFKGRERKKNHQFCVNKAREIFSVK